MGKMTETAEQKTPLQSIPYFLTQFPDYTFLQQDTETLSTIKFLKKEINPIYRFHHDRDQLDRQ